MMARDHVEVVAEHEYTAKDRLTDLMNQYEQPLYAYLLVLAGDREVAADCLQETFLRAYQNLARGKPVNGQWLYKVARHRGSTSTTGATRHRQLLTRSAAPQ